MRKGDGALSPREMKTAAMLVVAAVVLSTLGVLAQDGLGASLGQHGAAAFDWQAQPNVLDARPMVEVGGL